MKNCKQDYEAAQRIKPTDTQRLQRALEVYHATGKALSQWHREQESSPLPYHVMSLAIAPKERAVLHQRIEKRFKQTSDSISRWTPLPFG